MLGGLQPSGRHAADGPAAATAPHALFGPDALIGFDPTQVSLAPSYPVQLLVYCQMSKRL